MPRDDLSIDFVKKMPQGEALDPGLILEDWINRIQNLPEEIRFTHDEIQDKDRQYSECIRLIEDRDAKIQKWIKTNGSAEPNPKEDNLRAQIRENFARADRLSKDKINLTQKLQHQFDKHIRNLDLHIKQLYDRNEPGFTNPDDIPSLLRPSAANHSVPVVRPTNPTTSINLGGPLLVPANTAPSMSDAAAPARLPAQVRTVQTQQHVQQHASSAPATPAASMILNRQQRESSAGPTPKRGVRTNTGLGTTPVTSSGLARHASLGPGTPKGGNGPTAVGTVRAGSAGPRSGSVKLSGGASGRRGTPQARKKPPNKSSLSRVKKASARNSPTSTPDSDLSDAVSGSEVEETDGPSRSTPLTDRKDADGDEAVGDADDDEEEEEGSDDKKYCLCHNVSYGDMVACDNDDCPYEWFHWSCVGLKSEPNGTWYCPVCTEKFGRKGK